MPTVAEFLAERMENAGIKHVFHVPGDYVLKFCKLLSDSDSIELINNTDENHAGFAADAYARVNGIGACCVTYNVGALKVANAVAGAYAERSPLVIISGSPGIKERNEEFLLHHMVRSFECQKEMFENITCASTILDNPNRAGYEIDRVFEALDHHKQPIYIELPRDIIDKSITYDVYKQGTPVSPETDQENLQEALQEVGEWIQHAEKPVIMAGVQLARFGLGKELIKFAEKANIPIVTTMLSKSVVDEDHRLFLGTYCGDASENRVKDYIEKSDCILMFGALLTDVTLGFMPARFQRRDTVKCSIEGLQVRNHSYENVQFSDFCKTLFKEDFSVCEKRSQLVEISKLSSDTFVALPDKAITAARFFEKIDSIMTKDMAFVADVGDSLFGAIDITVHHSNQFLSPAFYTSMGYAIPGALGVGLAKPNLRTMVLTGDGSFQMSCTEISKLARYGVNPIIMVLNNKGYATERFLLDGPFNDVENWDYHKITDLVGSGVGLVVQTEGELEEALATALKTDDLFVINVDLEKTDVSLGLRRVVQKLTERVVN
ncbi:MAG: alpha-keto acid decarboxylase family protein [Candidatus Thorarchaeota archaeon]|jgi:indolepyruvate decarboxylase